MTEYSRRLIKIGMWKWIISLYQIQLHSIDLSFSFFHRRQTLPRAIDWCLICFIFRDKESIG